MQSLGRYTIPGFFDAREDFVAKLLPQDPQLAALCREHAEYIANEVHMLKLVSLALQKINSDHQVSPTLLIPVMVEGIVRNAELQGVARN